MLPETEIKIKIIVMIMTPTIIIKFLPLSKQVPQMYFSAKENEPSPLILYKSHYSHRAPKCPV